jgi:hypothetical protein
MRILGRNLSNWWLLSIPPLLFFALPLLLMGSFVLNNLAGAIIGPPAIWSRAWSSPPRSDVVGRYLESERHLDQAGPSLATLALEADGSMIVNNLPYEFGTSSCVLAGKGSWTRPDQDQKISLELVSVGWPGSCASGSYTLLELAGHFKPYKLYWVVGDPDSGTGIWLHKN